MTPQRHQLLLEAFVGLCDLTADERASRIDMYAHDDEFRRQLESLLVHHDRPIGPLSDEGWSGLGARVLARGLQAAEELPQTVPQHIGRYRIIRVVGEGGMGIVYEAQQEHPRRRVALKVMRPGLVSPSMIRRFRRETEVLGRLRHPDIAQILEAGVTDPSEGGRPFFAMELIDGRPLLAFAADHALSTRQRLALMARICDALHHAHENGVIHRDLKPANILVESPDQALPAGAPPTATARGEPGAQPKILDFGVARVTNADLQTLTLQTQVGQLVGTLPYMSPEQVTADASLLDGRSDLYSVGVIIHELLTGELPYDLTGKAIPELARIIQEQEPTRLGAIDRRLRGDVEAIVAKALEKDRERRYASAAELAADIRRHLDGRPIVARTASTMHRVYTFVRRRKPLVASSAIGAAGAAMLVTGALVIAGTTASDGGRSVASRVGGHPPGASSPNVLRIRSAGEWQAANPTAEAYAFDEFHPGVRPTLALAGGNGPVTLPLRGGSVTLRTFDRAGRPRPAIVDLSTRAEVSDAVILPGGTLVLEFDPPITAFYGMFGSLGVGETVTANLFAADVPLGFATSDSSVHKSSAQGYGFLSPIPFDRIELATSEPGNVLLGTYMRVLTNEGLGTLTVRDSDGASDNDVDIDFACVFDR